MSKFKINKELVQKLIKNQFPEYAHLTIRRVKKSGHDNRTFHLGDKMTIRLPSGEEYASQVEKELFWLPKLKQNLSLPISIPLAKGEPSADYPFSWSINQWIEGDTANYGNVIDLNQFATDLAGFLKELQAINTFGGPVAGNHNFYRGGDLSVYHEQTQTALKNLKSLLPTDKLNDIWQTALGSKWTKENVWVHGDVAIGNLLVKDGKFCGVIDFGMLGVGDPTCDYAIAWTFFDKESRKTFFEELGCDKDTWNRARGWALWKAMITYNEKDLAENAEHTIKAIMNEKFTKLPNFIRVIIQNKKGELLVIFQKKWNCWVFPGGKIEPNETPLEAAKREVFEETNLTIEDLEIVAEQDFGKNNQRQTGYLVKANKYSGEIKIKELDKIAEIKFKQIDYEFAVNRLFYAIIFEVD